MSLLSTGEPYPGGRRCASRTGNPAGAKQFSELSQFGQPRIINGWQAFKCPAQRGCIGKRIVAADENSGEVIAKLYWASNRPPGQRYGFKDFGHLRFSFFRRRLESDVN